MRDLILAIVTKSANDAATVLAEGLAGSEPNFVQYMNLKARQLGIQHTWYRNASGLPDPDQRTTARDVARLALALYHQFPREYRYFSTREFDFRGEIVHGHNHLLDWYQGADGIKTGYVNASGFNLAASAVRNGRRQIGVIMGGRSWHSRDAADGLAARPGLRRYGRRRAGADPLRAAGCRRVATSTVRGQRRGGHSSRRAAAGCGGCGSFTVRARRFGRRAAAIRVRSALSPGRRCGISRRSAKAEAAPLPHEPSAGDRWAIQLGAFHDEAAAEEATRHVAGLAVAKSKPHADPRAGQARFDPALSRAPLAFHREGRAGRLCRAAPQRRRLFGGAPRRA